MESMAVITVLLLVGAPNFWVSVFRCGFQCGTISKMKWLVKASGIAIKGFGIFVAMRAPTKTCGVSSIVNTMLYNRSMLVNFGAATLGILIFLFVFWNRLKEDYASEIIFQSATCILIGIGVGCFLSVKFFPEWFFWTSLAGGLIGFSLAILRIRLKFYETLEAFIISSLPGLSLVFLVDSVTRSSLSSFLAFIVILITIFVSYYFDMHYKGFTWYKSGKIGFAGLAVAGLIFLIRSLLATGRVPVISFAGSSEGIISGIAAFTSFLLLFNLGRVKK